MAKEFAKAFYKSRKWQACRKSYISNRIMIDGGLCELCGEIPGIELHHKTSLNISNINDVDITLNHENLMFLCKDCHFNVHKEEILKKFEMAKKPRMLNKNRLWFDEKGQPQNQKIYIVYGAPASGKSTFVKNNKVYGDLVVDLDLLKQAISMCNKTETPDNLLNVALTIRDRIYSMIKQEEIDCKNIWVIASLPDKNEREELADELGAELIFIDAKYSDCIARANADEERKDKLFQEYIIKKWFENYRA